jgi:hypothetical protein
MSRRIPIVTPGPTTMPHDMPSVIRDHETDRIDRLTPGRARDREIGRLRIGGISIASEFRGAADRRGFMQPVTRRFGPPATTSLPRRTRYPK